MDTETPERTIDVREIDGAPFDDIMSALSALGNGEQLHLIAPFEPEPLYGVLEARGFEYEIDRRDDLWHLHVEPA